MRTTTYASRPGFVVDPNSVTSNQGRQPDWSKIPEKYRRGAVAVVLTAEAAFGGLTIAVEALAAELPAGRALAFGDGLAAITTATAPAGSESVAVQGLISEIPEGATAYFQPPGYEAAGKVVPAGKVLVELASGLVATRAERPGAETARFISKTPMVEDSVSDSRSGYGMITGANLFENLLPDADPITGLLPDAYKTELRANGGAFVFDKYEDNR